MIISIQIPRYCTHAMLFMPRYAMHDAGAVCAPHFPFCILQTKASLNLHFQPLSNVRCVQRKTPKRFMFIDASGRVRITITRSCLIRSARHVPSLGNNAIHYTCPSIDACRAERKEPWLKSRPATPFSFHSCCNLVFPRHHPPSFAPVSRSTNIPLLPSNLSLFQVSHSNRAIVPLQPYSSLLLIPQFFNHF